MSENELLNAFDECIAQVALGVSIDDCLINYPRYAKQLRPMLETARLVNRVRVPSTEVEYAHARVRTRVLAALADDQRRKATVFFIPARAVAMAAAVLLVFAAVFFANRAQPGDMLYALRQLIENVQQSINPPSPTPFSLVTLTATTTQSPTPTSTETATNTASATLTSPLSANPSRTPAPTLTPSASATPTTTLTASATACQPTPPATWVQYTISTGDNLLTLATVRGVTTEQVMAVNCLVNPNLIAIGQVLYLPPAPLGSSPTAQVIQPTALPVQPTQVPQPTQAPVQPTTPPSSNTNDNTVVDDHGGSNSNSNSNTNDNSSGSGKGGGNGG